MMRHGAVGSDDLKYNGYRLCVAGHSLGFLECADRSVML